MKKLFSKLIVATMALSLLITGNIYANGNNSAAGSYTYRADVVTYPIYVDEEQSDIEFYQLNVNGTTYLSLRDISRIIKRDIIWNNEKKEIRIGEQTDVSYQKQSEDKLDIKKITATQVYFPIYVEGVRQNYENPLLLADSRTYLAVRDIAKILDINIYWDNSSRSIYIGYVDLQSLKDKEEQRKKETENKNDISEENSQQQVYDAYATEMLKLVNEFRAENGLPKLKLVPEKEVQDYVKLRAKEISDKFSHTRPDGSDYGDSSIVSNIYYAGENIAAGNRQYTAQDAVDSWKKSAGHRANMLHAPYTHMYSAYYYNSSKQYENYHVQMFFFEK